MSIADRLMPELAGAGPRTRAAVTVAAAAMPAALAGVMGLTESGSAAASGAVAYAVVLAVGLVSMMAVLALRAATAASDRGVWIAVTAAAGMWMAGTVWESTIGHADGAAIGPADALWLSFYPLAYVAVVLRARETAHRLPRSLRADGLIATGIGVSVDDFGTGYSSLGLLKHLPVDELKIDRTFVRDVLTDPADAAIVQSVVDLGGRLGLRTVAEGVEDAGTLDRIAEYGVTVAQGYHIARPLPGDELERWLAARHIAV